MHRDLPTPPCPDGFRAKLIIHSMRGIEFCFYKNIGFLITLMICQQERFLEYTYAYVQIMMIFTWNTFYSIWYLVFHYISPNKNPFFYSDSNSILYMHEFKWWWSHIYIYIIVEASKKGLLESIVGLLSPTRKNNVKSKISCHVPL